MASKFQQANNNLITIDKARDDLHTDLASKAPHFFAWGQFVNLDHLLSFLLETPLPTMQSELTCQNAHMTTLHVMHTCLIHSNNLNGQSIQSWMANPQDSSYPPCTICHTPRTRHLRLLYSVPFLVFEFSNENTSLSANLIITVLGDQRHYTLKGIIYYGNEHFTSRIISNDNMVWYHDGMTTGPHMVPQGPLSTISNLMTCRNRHASVAIYTLL